MPKTERGKNQNTDTMSETFVGVRHTDWDPASHAVVSATFLTDLGRTGTTAAPPDLS